MNMKSMRIRSYRSFKVDEHVSPEAAERYRTLSAYRSLRDSGCDEAGALAHVGISRRTLYRWKAALAAGGQRGLAPKSTRPRRVRQRAWKPRDVKAVLDVRRKYPFMGKARIQAMLARKGRALSVSTVGRILERALGTGAIRPASFCEGRVKPRRRRSFAKWARRWKYGARARKSGELVQVDHMTCAADGQTLKEFRAICPVSRFMVTRVCSRATAGNARRFLMDLVGALPFPLRSLPRRPQWNGCVERTNRSARAEFWNLCDGPLTVERVAPRLSRYEFFFNYERPHTALAYRTPNEYLVAQEAA